MGGAGVVGLGMFLQSYWTDGLKQVTYVSADPAEVVEHQEHYHPAIDSLAKFR